MSTRCPTKSDSNKSAELPRLARILSFGLYKYVYHAFQITNNKGTDQTGWMLRMHGLHLCCTHAAKSRPRGYKA